MCWVVMLVLNLPLRAEQTYLVRGIWRSWDARARRATIQHDAVPELMPAMTMPFTLATGEPEPTWGAGTWVEFRLRVTDEASFVDHVVELGGTAEEGAAAMAATAKLQAGDLLPALALETEQRQRITLPEWCAAGPVAITFVFTRCPLPEFCPLLSARFAQAQAALQRVCPGEPWRLLSITLDPQWDTPARLREYAQAHGAESGRWSLARAEGADFAAFLRGLELTPYTGQGAFTHRLCTLVVDRQGRIQRVFTGSAWSVEMLVAEMRALTR